MVAAHLLQEKVETLKEQEQEIIKQRQPKKDCTPYVAVEQLGDSSVVLIVRAWAKTSDYWNVLYDTYEAIYKQLPLNGLHFPFPQMDVNLKKI